MSDFKVGDTVRVRHNLGNIDAELTSLKCYTPGISIDMVKMEGKTYKISKVNILTGYPKIYILEGHCWSFIHQYLEFVSGSIDDIIKNAASYDELSSFLK